MRLILQAIKFKDVLPSALLVLSLGCILAFFLQPISWLGQLSWLAVPYGVGLGVFFYALVYLFTCSKVFATDSMNLLHSSLHDLFRNFTWPQILIVSLLAGVGEELLIRGVLQSWLVDLSNPIIGIVMASLIFGFLHFLSKTYVIVTFILGLAFGIAYYLSQSMIFIMIAHTVYDILAFAMIVKNPHMLGIDSLHDKQT